MPFNIDELAIMFAKEGIDVIAKIDYPARLFIEVFPHVAPLKMNTRFIEDIKKSFMIKVLYDGHCDDELYFSFVVCFKNDTFKLETFKDGFRLRTVIKKKSEADDVDK